MKTQSCSHICIACDNTFSILLTEHVPFYEIGAVHWMKAQKLPFPSRLVLSRAACLQAVANGFEKSVSLETMAAKIQASRDVHKLAVAACS